MYPAKKAAAQPIQAKNIINDPNIDVNQRIGDALKLQCVHHNAYYNQQGKKICSDVANLIIKNNGCSKQNYSKFIDYIIKESTDYYGRTNTSCCLKNCNEIKNSVQFIFKSYFPSANQFYKLLKYPDLDSCYISLEDQNFKYYKHDYIKVFVQIINEMENVLRKPELITHMAKHIESNEENLNVMIECKNEPFAEFTSQLIDKYEGSLDDNMITIACRSLPHSKSIINSLMNRGMKLDSQHLEIVCSSGDAKSIEFILAVSKMPVKPIHFKKLIESQKKKPKNQRYYWKNLPDEYESLCTPEKIDILIKHGYKIDYSDVELSITNKQIIPNIEKFNIVLDKKLLKRCWANNFYPPYKFNCIDQEMVELQKICSDHNLSNIRSFINKYKLVPDEKCMDNASKLKSNHKTLELLVSKGGVVDLKCIENSAKLVKSNTALLYLIKEFKTNNDKEIQTYKDKIKELEESIIKLGGTIPKEDTDSDKKPEKIKKPIKSNQKLSAKPKKAGKNPKITPKNKNIVIIDDEDDEYAEDVEEIKNEENKDNKDNKQNIAEENNKKEENQTTNPTNNPSNVIELDIDSQKVLDIQKQYKLKSVPNNKVQTVFKLQKGKKVSYNDVKKILVDKIRDESWMDDKNKNLIKIPDEVKNKLNIESNGLIKFNDIDKLVCMFFI